MTKIIYNYKPSIILLQQTIYREIQNNIDYLFTPCPIRLNLIEENLHCQEHSWTKHSKHLLFQLVHLQKDFNHFFFLHSKIYFVYFSHLMYYYFSYFVKTQRRSAAGNKEIIFCKSKLNETFFICKDSEWWR